MDTPGSFIQDNQIAQNFSETLVFFSKLRKNTPDSTLQISIV